MDDNFKNDTSVDPNRFVDRIVAQSRDVLIEFRTLRDILDTEASWFDGYGNLCVNVNGEVTHLAPSYFSYLGQRRLLKSHHSFPNWCIQREWDDLFAANTALRYIASGKMNKEDMIALAKKSVLIP